MKRLKLIVYLVLSLLPATSLSAQPAAEPPSTSPGDQAIQKGQEALALFERGKWAEAAESFAQADQLYHSPVFLLYQARSLRNLGRVREAKHNFELLARELLDASAPPQWIAAQTEGAKELEDLELTAPRLVIEIEGGVAGVRATVDGVAVDVGVVSIQDPGDHRVRVTRGSIELERTVNLRLGRPTLRESFRLPSPPKPPAIDPWLVLGASLTSLGGAALVVGGAMGGVALQKSADAKRDLPLTCTADLHCRDEDEAVVEARFAPAYQFASAADGLFIGGAVLAVAGIVVLIVDPGGKHVAPTARGMMWRFE